MATGGGPSKDGDYSKTWKNASAFMERRDPDPASQDSADQVMDQQPDPGDVLHQDMQEMSIHRDPMDPDDPGEEVRNPTSFSSSSESISSVSRKDNDTADANKTAIMKADSKGGKPKTSTPKSVKKNPKLKSHKPKPSAINLNTVKNLSKTTDTPRIDKFLINTNQNKDTPDTPVAGVPNILDWFDAVDNTPTHTTNSRMSPQPASDSSPEPLPQRENIKTTKRKRVASDGTSKATATSCNNVTVRPSDDVINVNKPIPHLAEEVINRHTTQDDSEKIAWLLGNYPTDEPLPEILVGKKVRFQVENITDRDITTNNATDNQQNTNPNSDSLQDGQVAFLNIPDHALPFFKRSRGCLSAASRADARATHLAELVTRGVPTPWALRLEPIPAYLLPIAHELSERQKANALKLMEEATHCLRRSCSKLVNQGNDNWNIVSKYVGDDDAELNRARLKMDSLVARDYDREKVRLDARNATLIATPVTDKAIVDNLKIRGYINPNAKPERSRQEQDRPQGANPNENNPAPNNNNLGARPKAPPQGNPNQRGRGKRRRSRSRSKSPNRGPQWGFGPNNRGRGRGGPQFRDNRRPPPGGAGGFDADAMAAMFRRFVQEMQPPTYQNQRGPRDDYRY